MQLCRILSQHLAELLSLCQAGGKREGCQPLAIPVIRHAASERLKSPTPGHSAKLLILSAFKQSLGEPQSQDLGRNADRQLLPRAVWRLLGLSC